MSKIRTIGELCRAKERGRCDQTTQFVVGAAGETDEEILCRTNGLYKKHGLSRAYFSAFGIPAGVIEPRTGNLLLDREHRLYQCDFLFRKYCFDFDEIFFTEEGNLSLEKDPKQMWADAHPEKFPLEINRASRESLLRVPGIGPTFAGRILKARREQSISSPATLRKMGIPLSKAGPYLLLKGKNRILASRPVQEKIWH